MSAGEIHPAFSLIVSSCFRTALPRNVGQDDRTNRNVERNETEQETI